MRKPLPIRLAILACMLFVQNAGPARAESTPEAVVAQFHAALAVGDRATVEVLMMPDAAIYESGYAERSFAEYASAHLGADIEFSRATTSEDTSQQVIGGGDLAVVLTERHTTGTFRGLNVDSMLKETMVLKREGDTWRIAHIHWSSASAGD